VRYFNTYGGSTVPIAAAQAVLDVIRDEKLIANAHQVGQYLLDELRTLAAPWPQIADVRGVGLFIGMDIVSDPETNTPDRVLAKAIVDDLRRHFVLISASGPAGNVLKIRPPLVFDRVDAARLLQEFSGTVTRCLHR
jgi:4-aminobutyrate aminotransferase-like enzyme